MSGENRYFSEDWGLVGTVDPDAYAAGNQLSDEIDMAKYEQLVAVCAWGDGLTATHTVTLTFHSSSTSGGSYAAITGKSAATTVTSPLSKDGQLAVELYSGDVTSNNRYVKANVNLADTASPQTTLEYGVLVFGKARHKPASDSDLASLSSIDR